MTRSNATSRPGSRYVVSLLGERHDVEVRSDGTVLIDGRPARASLASTNSAQSAGRERVQGIGDGYSLLLDGASFALRAHGGRGGAWHLELDGRCVSAEVLDPRAHRIRRLSAKAGADSKVAPLRAPMPGLVVQVAVDEGQEVEAGDTVLIVEAMKMENELRAPAAARVKRLLAAPGDAVEKGQLLVEFAEAGEA
ncbi:MAG: biotin/lipoyl-binding protein [Gemmatimonadetes bacterium]|nr:biotin/lipoyl-binding protein [Gemmatimonadota bacterium]MYB98247.1 biotin/lipoyl-binding protein [Gemmatimonadota bacterium]MYI46436.1 biotin/lipoyl-binding protein [Gemmatimonadota bacterium]